MLRKNANYGDFILKQRKSEVLILWPILYSNKWSTFNLIILTISNELGFFEKYVNWRYCQPRLYCLVSDTEFTRDSYNGLVQMTLGIIEYQKAIETFCPYSLATRCTPLAPFLLKKKIAGDAEISCSLFRPYYKCTVVCPSYPRYSYSYFVIFLNGHLQWIGYVFVPLLGSCFECTYFLFLYV